MSLWVSATPEEWRGASAQSHRHSLTNTCWGPWASPSPQLIAEGNWGYGAAKGDSVHLRPLGEEAQLTGMLATLSEAERGEIKRSLV